MKPIKHIFVFLLALSLFTHCSSAQKLQLNAPMSFGKIECQSWIAGVKGGGSGINLFLPILGASGQNIELDSVFFRGKAAKLELLNDKSATYVGRFKSNFNKEDDVIINEDNSMENPNKTSELIHTFPFDLKDSECVVSYKKGGEIQYYKIENIIEKKPIHYPSAPPNRQ